MQVIRNGYVVTCDPLHRSWERADIVIDGGIIRAIGPEAATPFLAANPGVEVIDASRRIVIPGLVNAHLHSNEAFEQGRFEGAPLEVWLAQCYPPLLSLHLPERLHYLRTMLCCLQSLKAGVTSVHDDLLNPSGDPVVVDGAMKAYRDSGLRASVAITFSDRPYLEGYPWLSEIIPQDLRDELDALPTRSINDQITNFESSKQRWHGAAGERLKVTLGPRGPQRCTGALLDRIADLSAQHALPVHMHVLETRTQAVTAQRMYGKSFIQVLKDRGLLTVRLTLNHAIWLTVADIESLAEGQCSTTHNPLSNMKLGSGVSPIRRLMNSRINVAIGTDGASTSDTFDQVEALHATALLHCLADPDPGTWINADEAIRMCTINGARTCMREDEIGSLEPGKKADLTLLDKRHPGFIPLNNPIRQLAYSANSEAVDTVIIGGRIVMRDREIVVFDERALVDEISEEAERYRREIGSKMENAAGRLVPHLKAMQKRALATPIPKTANPRLN